MFSSHPCIARLVYDSTLLRNWRESDGDPIDDGGSSVEVAEVTDVARFGDRLREVASPLRGSQGRGGEGVEADFGEDRLREGVDISICDVPQVRNETGTGDTRAVSGRSRTRKSGRTIQRSCSGWVSRQDRSRPDP